MVRKLQLHHVALLSLLVLFILAAGRPIDDPDFFWHLKAGQTIWTQGTIPRSDIFSFSNAGHPWITHEWLAEVLYYLAYRVGGYAGLTTAFLLILCTVFGLFYRLARLQTGRPFLSAVLTLAAAILTMVFWVYRPHLMGYGAFLAFIYILEQYRRGGTRLIWALPAVMVFWVNIHGSYIMGLILIGLYLISGLIPGLVSKVCRPSFPARLTRDRWTARQMREMAAVFFLSLGASILNPNTYKIIIYPFFTVGNANIVDRINEWASPDFHQPVFQLFLVLVLVLWTLAILYEGPHRPVDLLQLFFFSALGFFAVRNIAFFVLACLPLMGRYLTGFIRERPSTRPRYRLHWAAGLGLLLAAALLWPGPNELNRHLDETVFPAAAVRYMQNQNLTGAVFNDYNWGGYLLWQRFPENTVFIDGRTDIYADKVYPDYLKIMKLAPQWSRLLAGYGPRLVLIKPGTPLAFALEQRADWREVFTDPIAVLFQRKE